jgi:hypothetical protein
MEFSGFWKEILGGTLDFKGFRNIFYCNLGEVSGK